VAVVEAEGVGVLGDENVVEKPGDDVGGLADFDTDPAVARRAGDGGEAEGFRGKEGGEAGIGVVELRAEERGGAKGGGVAEEDGNDAGATASERCEVAQGARACGSATVAIHVKEQAVAGELAVAIGDGGGVIDAEEGVFGGTGGVGVINPHVELESEGAGEGLAEWIEIDGGGSGGGVFVDGEIEAFGGAIGGMGRGWNGGGRGNGGIIEAELGGEVEPDGSRAIEDLEAIGWANTGDDA